MNPLEIIYFLGYSLKKNKSLRHRRQLPHKVVSIGNITVGGTGKTPATIALAEEALKSGFHPVILTRGYRGKAKGPCFVSKGNGPLLSVDDAGDEPVIMAERLKDVPVVKSADRYEGGVFALRNLGNDEKIIFILDDGFQHWRLKRDIDIVLVDGLKPFGNRSMLPVGPLRGPLTELKNADIFVITKVRNEMLGKELKELNGSAPVFFSSYEITGLRDYKGEFRPAEQLKNKNIFAFCGIANPGSCEKTLASTGCNVLGMKTYRDHYGYGRSDVLELSSKANNLAVDYIITTEKDMVKLKVLQELPANLFSLEIGVKADAGFYDEVFRKLQIADCRL